MNKKMAQPLDKKLLDAFDAFNDYSLRLREAYLAMKERASAIDLKLAETNKKLHKKVEELNDLTSYLNDLLTSMPSGVITTDLEGRVKTINPSAQKILELCPETVVGNEPGMFLDRDGRPLFSRFLREENATPSSEERRIVLSKAKTVTVNASVSYLRDARNHPMGKVEILNDITDLMNLRKKVHSLDKLAALGEMAAGISHEIRNPLNAIEGFVRLLERTITKELKDPKVKNYVEKIQEGVRKLDGIVNSFLSFAHPDKLRLKSFRISDLLAEVKNTIPELSPWKARNSCPIKVHSCGKDVDIEGDFLKLKHALLNLISNGISALNGRGGISIRAKNYDREVMLRVCDTGCGISSDELEKIFHPFYTTREEGTGLGLPIVRKVVDLHAGRIKAWSRRGRGTIFTILLPKRQGHAEKRTSNSPERSNSWQ